MRILLLGDQPRSTSLLTVLGGPEYEVHLAQDLGKACAGKTSLIQDIDVVVVCSARSADAEVLSAVRAASPGTVVCSVIDRNALIDARLDTHGCGGPDIILDPNAEELVVEATLAGAARINQSLRRLRKSDGDLQKLQRLLRNAPLAVAAFDEERRFTLAEGQLLNSLGWSSEQLLGKSSRSIFGELSLTEDDGTPIPPAVVTARISAGEVIISTVRYRDLWLENRYFAMRGENGRIDQVYCVTVDATARKRAEEAKHRSDQEFRQFIEAMPDAVYAYGQDGTITYANPAFCAVLHVDVHDLVGSEATTWIHPDDAPLIRARQEALWQDTRSTSRAVIRLVATTGQTVFLDGSALRAELNGLPVVLVTARDVTEAIRSRENLWAAEARLKSAVENAPICILATDRDGRFTFVGGQGIHDTGIRPEELVGESIFEALARSGSLGEDLLREPAAVVRRALDGESVAGELHWGGRTFEHRTVPIRTTEGILAGAISVATDVTERLVEQRRRRAQEESFRTVIESSPDPIAVTRGERLIYSNPAMALSLGYPRGDSLFGVSILDLLPAEVRQKAREMIHSVAETGRAIRGVETPLRRLDGVDRLWECSAERIVFEGAEAVLFVGRDVTERREMQKQLMLSDRLASMGMLAAGLAHEINNPLAYVFNNLEWALEVLASPPGCPPDVLEALREAREGADRVRQIVRDLKVFSRPESESEEDVDVCAVVESAIVMVWNEIRHRAQLVRDLRPVPTVRGNRARLGQVLVNLLVNAAHAIPEGGANHHRIIVATRTNEEGHAVIEVTDTGAGISHESLPRIFDAFFTTKPVGLGSGLGLSICNRIVSAMNGKMDVESEVGRGTKFTVTLPRAESLRRAASAAQPQSADHSGRILIVDDDAQVAKSIRRLLARHDVVVLGDAREALERVRAERFDLVLCDLMMPGMTGMDFYDAVYREQPELAAKIVFLTGGAFTPNAEAFLARVSNSVAEKPIDAAQLRTLVRTMLEEAAK